MIKNSGFDNSQEKNNLLNNDLNQDEKNKNMIISHAERIACSDADISEVRVPILRYTKIACLALWFVSIIIVGYFVVVVLFCPFSCSRMISSWHITTPILISSLAYFFLMPISVMKSVISKNETNHSFYDGLISLFKNYK